MLNNLQAMQGFKYHPGCNKMRLNHLCFADNLFIFCRGDLQSVEIIMSTLKDFHSLFGLNFNKAKSNLFCAGIKHTKKTALLNCLGF